MHCKRASGIFFLAAFSFFLFLMASGAGALGISDGTFSPQTGVERGKAYSQSVLLLNSPNRDNHLVVTVGGDVGAWVTSISPSDFNITANQQQLIALAISVPANATFGSHTGTVTATATDPAGGAGIIEATKGNLYATVMGSVVCGDGVCDSGESSSNCCMDCPSTSGGGGVSYGPWYCSGSGAKARLVSNSSYACNSQTKAYGYVTTNATEASQCEAGTVCSNGNCIINQTAPVCGNNVCESGESSSNCCTDCPSNAGGVGVAYGSWYCRDSATKARTVSTTEYKCSNQTKLYEHVTTNSTEAQACPSGQACSGGSCGAQTSVCGNGACESGEDSSTCPQDCKVGTCTDSDGGKNYYSRGIVNTSVHSFSFVDQCLRSSTTGNYDGLEEYYCTDSTYEKWNHIVVTCKNGCTDGACAAGGILPLECIDKDGEDIYTAGEAVNQYGGGQSDCCVATSSGGLCYDEGPYVKEGVCRAGYGVEEWPESEKVFKCPGSCRKGACIPSATNATLACTDSDGGNNIYAAGYVTYNGVGYKDYCAQPVSRQDGTVALDSVSSCSGSGCNVFEYWCGGTQGVESQSYSCPQGCKEGSCVSASSDEKCMNFYYYGGRFDYGTAKQICADVGGFDWKSRGWPEHPSGKRGDETIEGWKLRVSRQAGVLEFSIATDKSSYLQGEQVRISSKAHVSGNLVDAYVKGYVIRPDGGSDELVFAKESCVQPACKPGAPCIALACPVQTGYLNAFYKPSSAGAYYIKATASYGGSLAESSAKFAVGVQKKAKLSAWLENYNYNPGDTVKIFAKLTDDKGEPVLGADVSASIRWAGSARPVYRELVGIESAAAKKVEQATVQATQGSKAAPSPDIARGGQTTVQAAAEVPVQAAQVAQAEAVPAKTAAVAAPAPQIAQAAVPATGYAIATIASSVEKQAAAPDVAGISYEEETRIATPPSKEVTAYPEPMPVAKIAPEYGYVKLEYNPKSGYYEGSYAIPSGAQSGTYKVAVFAGAEGQNLQESTSFTLGGEDYLSFENKAKKFASDGDYKECVDNYLKAADRLSADQYRMFLDIEKAGICARLGSLPNSFYKDVGKIVEKAAGEGKERYVLLGIASQYYELGGEYRMSRELLGKAASGLEDISGVLDKEQSILAKSVLAKYYALLGEGSKSASYYKEAADLLVASQHYGSESFLQNLFAAKFYAKAGDLDSSRKQYLIAADDLSGKSSGSDVLISAFIAGDSYERAGEQEKAREQYARVVGLNAPGSYGAGDSFFAYGAIGKSYERLGEKQKAKEMYEAGLERLLSKQDAESYYFASGLSGYLGDYGKSKELCRKQFEQSLSEEGNIGKLTFMNAYCYSVLGDSGRAKKGCDLNSITLQGDTMVMEILEPLPPPVSYCSQSTDAKRTSSCGNGVVDAGESPENCCADTGCAFGDTCSKALGKCVKPVEEIPQETVLEVLMKLEDARIKLDALEGKALAISKYYSGKDQPKADAWDKASKVFAGAKANIDNIKKDLRDNREKITEGTLEGIRQKLEDVRGSLKDAIDAILEAV